ncbi:hypothetical protein [uncultured Helicobacter sp.]|uniref:hypothetical protein n=1 Tax=uncultured Helicobacter sp. TaxID=175537 RepID=UPI00374EE2B5
MKTRKLALSLAFMAMFSSLTYAETADEEIARLKKENELLELQQKKCKSKKQ